MVNTHSPLPTLRGASAVDERRIIRSALATVGPAPPCPWLQKAGAPQPSTPADATIHLEAPLWNEQLNEDKPSNKWCQLVGGVDAQPVANPHETGWITVKRDD